MEAFTYKLKTPMITTVEEPHSARRHGINVRGNQLLFGNGRKNKLHCHFGEDHTFVVLDGQATFYNKEHRPSVLNKGEAIMLPVGCL